MTTLIFAAALAVADVSARQLAEAKPAGLDGPMAPHVMAGTFVQKKILKDVDVTLTSTGTWTFEKDKAFTWQTLKPVPSLFTATPTNYTFSAGGRTMSHKLAMKIEDLAQIFEIKEMKAFVERVETDAAHPVATSGDVAIPSSLRVFFKNGDRVEIALAGSVGL